MSLFLTMQNSFINPSFPHRANCLKAIPTKRHLALNAPNLSHNTADEGDRLGGGRQGAWPIVHPNPHLFKFSIGSQGDSAPACYLCRLGKVTGGYRPQLCSNVQLASKISLKLWKCLKISELLTLAAKQPWLGLSPSLPSNWEPRFISPVKTST